MINRVPCVKELFGAFLAMISFSANAQLVMSTANLTISQLVQQQLMGPGASAFNIVFNGTSADEAYAPSVGAFECTDCNIQLNEGLALSTGNVFNMVGPNNTTSQTSNGLSSFGNFDPDMYQLVMQNGGDELNDMTIVEFDFIPYGDTISFDFIWASEEYDSYVSSAYNDVFGLFISGPGINGPFQNGAINLGVLPGTDIPVSVNTINNGQMLQGPCMNCQYYNQPVTDSELWGLLSTYDPYVFDTQIIQYDGYTDVLSNGVAVQCGQVYHVKMAICDASDNSLDSGVFIRKGTLTSNYAAYAALNMNVDGPNNNSVYEDCGEGALRIHRPQGSNLQNEITCYLDWSGNAQEGIDYNVMPDSIVIAAQQPFVDIPFDAFSDAIVEFADTVVLSMMIPQVCGDVDALSSFTFYIADVTNPFIVQGWSDNLCAGTYTLEPYVQGGFGNYSYLWSTGSTLDQLEVMLTDTVQYTVTVSDTCGVQSQTVNFTFNVAQADPLTVSLEDTDGILPLQCGDYLSIYAYPTGGLWPYTFAFSGLDGTWIFNDNNMAQIGPGNAGEVMVIAQDACGDMARDTLLVTVDVPPFSLELPDTIMAMCGEEVFIESTISGGNPGSVFWYSWSLDGVYQGNWTASNVFWSFTGNTEVVLASGDDCSQMAFDTTYVLMTGFDSSLPLSDSLFAACDSIYGCIDPMACNYDSLAVYEDGSCYTSASLVIDGPTFSVAGDVGFYWVADYFPGADLIWTVENGELISSQDSGCTVMWYGGLGTLCVHEAWGESCIGDTTCFEVDATWGVGEAAQALTLQLFPNPVNQNVQVVLSNSASAASWYLYSIDGRLVKAGSFSGKSFRADLSDVPSGSYGINVIAHESRQWNGILIKE